MADKKRLRFEMILDEHPLRIEAAKGSSRRLMVSFTSVGTEREKWPPKEFIGIASQQGKNHVICVTDISRCWMNAEGMARKVVTTISDYILDNGITNLMTMGVSMGAYNALLLGQMMPVQRVIAFAPQYSVHPEVMPDEKRWWFFRKQIEKWPHREMNKLPRDPAKVFIFHGDTADERMHWKKFPSAENVKHYIFSGADHNFVLRLKENDTLRKITVAAINNRIGRMGKVVARAGGLRREDYDGFDAALEYFHKHGKIRKPASLEATK